MVLIESSLLLLSLISTQYSVVSSDPINLMVLGDWGGIPVPPFHTLAQVEVSKAMGIKANEIQATAVLALGDNFYFGIYLLFLLFLLYIYNK